MEKAVASGVIVAGVASLCYPNVRTLALYGRFLPSWMVFGAIGATSSIISDLVHSYVLPEIGINNKAADELSMVMGAAISVGALYGAMYLMTPQLSNEFGLGCTAIAGVAGEFGGAFLVNLVNGT